ncbi:high affinity immunoglobulin gamma Fc receptor I-like [Acanthopagrus latus]|uniref:high affinity immunoglobulin gamma Fc receptor I-like n=1 Tax=Acanthopagrus latus TaxID=8177 RepID=UPI00187C3746|nr:high affinity immunoglobulin gamma Fc receptor I-like [Acanthopagrus latus]
MNAVISLLVLSTLPLLVVPVATSVDSVKAAVEIVSGDPRIFSGESVRLKCSVSDVRSTWDYLWFRGSEKLPQQGEHLLLWRAHVKQSGNYYCQGVRDSAVGDIYTSKSLPVEINVDGGWAILQVPPTLSLVGDTLVVTCRVRGTSQLREVILYKEGIEVMRQKGLNPHFTLTNVTVADQGMYSCRASWDIERRTRSVISVDTLLQVVEVLSEPVLEIVTVGDLIPANMMRLNCHHQYNAPAPKPPVHYYFFRNNLKLGMATSENHDLVKRTPGQYTCKIRVPVLGLVRWSQPKSFGQVTELQMTKPPVHPRDPWTRAPVISSPSDPSLPPASEPTAALLPPHQSTATPTVIQTTEAGTPSSGPPSSQPAPRTVPSTAQSLNKTTLPETDDITEQSGDTPEDDGDVSGDMSGDMSGDGPKRFW